MTAISTDPWSPRSDRTLTTHPSALELAKQAAEAVQELNHRTRDARAFTGPAELYRLHAEHDAGRLRSDTRTDPDPIIAAAAAELVDAGDAAHDLADVLAAAQQQLAHLGATQPDRTTHRRSTS
jgi:hypothetical protein